MGFYGNITNASRTQFSFDKISPNKYELFKNATTDGVYVGRYALVEYDLDTGADSFVSTLYKYGNDMYTSAEVFSANGTELVIPPQSPGNKVTAETVINGSILEDNTIVRILPKHHLANINDSHFYIQVTDYQVDTMNPNLVTFKYKAVSEYEYNNWVELNYSNSSQLFNVAQLMTESDYEPGLYYIFNPIEQSLELSWDAYDPDAIYYIKGSGIKLFLYSQEDGFSNSYFYSEATDIFSGKMFMIRRGCSYILNQDEELWYCNKEIVEESEEVRLIWNQITNEHASNYYRNFNIDKIRYPSSGRGYDSTVWQKVYATGQQYYIMVAELNTIVPNFGISSTAPTLSPIQPYFDTDSTNIYYKLVIQPSWGFRIKSANNELLGNIINKNGIPSNLSSLKMTEDEINYPSDVAIEWKNKFYDKTQDAIFEQYYNPDSGDWENYDEGANYKLKSAIYFNKDGFNSEEINYSKDLIDIKNNKYNQKIAESGWTNDNNIQVAATGYSGATYAKRDGSQERTPQVDTQELSIMIPALGDTIAQMWDLIYGGRLTNDDIAKTNKRNLDISWEDANKSILRSGLRLVREQTSDNGFTLGYDNAKKDWDGEVINLGEINTLAGCINSVHDLMGMILVSTTEEDLQDQQKELANQETFRDYKNIDGNKIYYFANDGTYRRKHETFEYKEVKYTYVPVELQNGTFIKNFYYYLDEDGETMIPSYDDEFDSNRQYYIKKMDATVSENQVYVPVDDLKPFNAHDKHFPYQKTLNGDFVYDDSEYPLDDDTVYYYVTNNKDNKMNLSGDYEPNKYFYCKDEDYDEINDRFLKWTLSEDKEASNIQYYTLIPTIYNKNLEFPEDLYDDVGTYFYCPGFFYYEDYSLLPVNQRRAEDIGNYYKQIPSPVETSETELYNINGKLYIPIDYDDYEVSSSDNSIQWKTDIYIKSGKIALDKSSLMTKGRQYYAVFTEINEENTSYVLDDDGNLVPAISSTAYNITTYRINMRPYMGNKYYRIDNSIITYYNPSTEEIISKEEYEALTEEEQLNYNKIVSIKSYALMTESSAELALTNDYNKQFKQATREFVDYYEIEAIATEAFYGANKYWYNTFEDKLLSSDEKDDWENGDEEDEETAFSYGDWIIDTNKKITSGRRYYLTVESQKKSGPYYRPYFYYYYDNELEKYVLDSSPIMKENTLYYKKNNFYILDDKMGKFSKGAIWKYADSGIPCVIKIASRTSFYEMQELKGFSRTFNTIHGLILRINNLLELDDPLTRNTKTMQGCINTLNDIINKFDELDFNKVLVTDQTGKIVTEDLKDLQVAYGPNNSKKKTLGQMLDKFEEIETKVDNLIFMTDAEMTSILNN